MSETSTPQGELIIGKLVHQAAMNCMIVPYDDPDGWFMKQFFSMSQIDDYAHRFNLVIKRQEQ